MVTKLPDAPQLGGTFQSDLADRMTSSVVDPHMLEEVAQLKKAEVEFERLRDSMIADQAEAVGYPEGDWELIVQSNPDLAKVLADKSADRERARSKRQKFDEVDPLAARGKSDEAIERLAKGLLPARKKNSHVMMVDPPDADGHRYGYSEIPKDRRSIERAIERGFTLDFRKLEFVKVTFGCDLPLATGTKCPHMAPTAYDLTTHKRFHHPQTYAMKLQAEAEVRDAERRAREEQRDAQFQEALTKIAQGGANADVAGAMAMMAEILKEMKAGRK